MIMKKLYRDDTLSSRKTTHILSPLPEVAAVLFVLVGLVMVDNRLERSAISFFSRGAITAQLLDDSTPYQFVNEKGVLISAQ